MEFKFHYTYTKILKEYNLILNISLVDFTSSRILCGQHRMDIHNWIL